MSRSDTILQKTQRRWTEGRHVWRDLLIAGLAVWGAYLVLGDAGRAWRAVLINFIFFTPLAAGMVVWPAAITAARGGAWLPPVRPRALKALGFAPVCFVAFIALFIGRTHWAPWLHDEHLHQGVWLSTPFLFGRDLVALGVFWWAARRFAREAEDVEYAKGSAGLLAFIYGIVFSLLGFDLVMALDPHWYSSLFGGYFFITGMYIGVAAWTFSVLRQDPPVDAAHRKDLGKLLVAFSILSTYMMYSQLLPMWYENLPDEVRFVIPRLRLEPWRWVSLGLLTTVYLGPLVLLISNRLKGNILYLRTIVTLVLVGMWIERWWLVTPTLGGPLRLGLPELGMTAAFLSAFLLSTGSGRKEAAP